MFLQQNTLSVNKRWMFITIVLCFILNHQTQAQKVFELMQDDHVDVKELERVGKKYFQNRDKGKVSGYKLFMRKLYWAKRNAGSDGRVISATQVLDESRRFQKSWAQKSASKRQRSSGWTELGPFNWTLTQSWTPGLGRIISIAVEPTQQNIIYAGSPGGGIWKSTNAGQSWQPLGDHMLNMSIWSIAIDPNNVNTVFIGNEAGQIMKSTNGGSSWTEIVQVSGIPRTILIHPNNSNTIFISTRFGIHRSLNGGKSFSKVHNIGVEDIAFKPGNPDIVYACGSRFFKSTNGGASFFRIFSIVRTERLKMAVTPANPDFVYLVQKRGNGFGYLYRSSNSGDSFSVQSDYNTVSMKEVYFTQAFRDMAIAVSDTDADEVHVGGLNYSRSLDGGVSFTTLATWDNPKDPSYVHADIEVLQYINGNIYAGTDGGIFRSTNQGNSMTDLTQGGLAVRQYYRIGGAATDANMIVGGAQDNGTNIMSGTDRSFKEWLGADGMECFIDHQNKNVVYGSVQEGIHLYKSTNGGNSYVPITKPVNTRGEWVIPFTMDPIDNKTIYVGYDNLYRHNSGGNSGSWQNLTQSINIGGDLTEIAIAASNNNYIYITEGGRVWRTKNGRNPNPTWVEVSGFGGSVNYITVDPNNPERVAIAGSGVYVSENAGATWTNIHRNLPVISAQCVVFDDTPANGLYVGMQSGVYYTNDNLSGWEPFSTNLPRVLISELEIHYPSRKIRVATYGRGIWEANLRDEGVTEINPPSYLVAHVNNQNVTLTWRDNSNNESGFKIERRKGGAFQVIGVVGANVKTFTDTDLAVGLYTYRVRAYRGTNYSAYSNLIQAVITAPIDPPTIVDNCEGCTVIAASSEETVHADYGKEKAVDGDLNTFWHTSLYDENSQHPHHITIDLGQERDLVGFSYRGRQTGSTGMVKRYAFYGSNGGPTWRPLAIGSFQRSPLKQTVDFDKFRCRYIRFQAISEVDGGRWASVAELTVRYEHQTNGRQTSQNTATDTKVDLQNFSGIKVFPVPFNNQLNIQGITSRKTIRSIRLIGVDGITRRASVKSEGKYLTIDTSKLPKGFYTLYLEENGVSKKIRLLKQ